jgi:transcriptional regulator with PAS, ATPase and Fis domain
MLGGQHLNLKDCGWNERERVAAHFAKSQGHRRGGESLGCVAPSFGRKPFRGSAANGLTELVGRQEELELLLRRWSNAKTGCQTVLISGEPGTGKSRLTVASNE